MSILINAATDKAQATLTLHADDNYYWTFFDIWKFDASSGTHGRVLGVQSGSGARFEVRCNSTGTFFLFNAAGTNSTESAVAVTPGEWNGLALRFDALGDATLCLRRPADSGFAVVCTVTAGGGVHQPVKPTLGSGDTGAYDSQFGKHAHARLFTGGAARSNTAHLSLADLNAEYASATLVKTSLGTNGVYEAWTGASNHAATYNSPTNDFAGTGTTIASPADNPTFGGSSTPIAALARHYAMLRAS